MSTIKGGVIPVLSVVGQSVAETWEKSLLQLWEHGCRIRTQYDQKDKDGNWSYPPSVDATLMMTVLDPSSEPAIHRAFPGGLEDLEEYRQEVVDGIKDHWCRSGQEMDGTKWEYTYHERLTRYKYVGWHPIDEAGCRVAVDKEVNQLQALVNALVKSPISRRVQAITWQPWKDPHHIDPPCLQSIWCRILPDENDVWHLNMNVRFRSRDAFDAAFMNMWAFVCLQEELAKQIAERAKREVRLGHYCDLSDSYHIYGRRQEAFEQGFLKQFKTRSFEGRTWTRKFAQPFFDEAKPMIAKKIREQDARDD
jgi:thymidylate synthase